ncbi:uncharacterized protein LOC125667473 isoform X3 [Ostrea edulis]|uniref:uncharacterized protein LOC125667473 isoform X3 n=1 Tax=Ostrea edulis TaxID=37623 RepID=UPI0024AF38CC|nr:uncharacterized protein LOC125667473 isoform X3 [Ostrea edulis]
MRLLLFFSFVSLAAAWSGTNQQLCSRTRVKCVWVWGCRYRTWSGCCAWGYINVEVRETEYFCCSKWKHNGNQVCNIPICPYDCGGSARGDCISPGICQCKAGFTGTYCSQIAACSHLRPCYPGYCTTGSNACQCLNNFSPQSTETENCLIYPTDEAYKPTIEQSTMELEYYHQVKQMVIYNMTIDSAMSPNNVETFWTNRRDANRIHFTFQSIFSSDTLFLPDKPSYIDQYDLGISEADIKARLTNLVGTEKYQKTLPCPGVGRDYPIHDRLYRCNASINDFNTRFDSGDTYNVVFRAKNGGFRIINHGGSKQYYEGRENTKEVNIKFDTETPVHCSESGNCPSPDAKMLHIAKDVTKTVIQLSWKGWRDELSKVARYALEVFKLEPDGLGNLKEPYTDLVPNPVPLSITEFNETTEGGEHTFIFRPSQPGVYSWILEANDRANNSAYARRFVIYDPVSIVTSDPTHLMHATSGNPGVYYEWQIENPQTVNVTWKNYFANVQHENGKYLNRIKLFPPSLSDGGDRDGYKRILDSRDDTEGTRTRDAIPNERGIIKYDFAHLFGKEQHNAPSYQNKNLVETSISISLDRQLSDGQSLTVWVKAYDILENTRVERMVLHYDSSPPSVSSLRLQKNVGVDNMDFSSRIQILGATDPHSGVKKIKYRFIARSTGELINNGEYEYENPQRDTNYCNINPCDHNLPNGDSLGKTITFNINNCHAMNVSDVSTEIVDIQMDIYNSAGLSISKSIQITDLTDLRGVHSYFGPMNVTLADVISLSSVKIMWVQAPSCYNIQGINFTYSKAGGKDEKAFWVHKNSPWFTMARLEAGVEYVVRLYTLYGVNERNPVRSEASIFNFTIPLPLRKPESQSGAAAVAGGVVGALVVIILLVVLLIFLVKTRRMENPITRIRSMSKRPPSYIQNKFDFPGNIRSTGSKSYNNRAYSQTFDDDVYYAENETPLRYQIVRSRITFEEEITRGKFAIIYKAKYLKDNNSTTVVAKTMKENPSQTDIEMMHAKVNFYAMKVGEHPNILKFIGVVDDNVLGRFMVLEYCENGPLKEYLKSKRHKVNDEMHEKLYRFACGICKGMNYLASHGVVHRRLAARNVLLTFLLETKITGFGPEPRENDGDAQAERIPIKWMAPECIKTTKYATEKSDVWSYGVVLWEIFSMGDAPYEGVKSSELDSRLKRGERLKKPEHSDDVFYKIMKRCWSYESDKRPNFEEILDELQTLFTGNIEGEDYYYTQGGLYDNRR